MPTTQMRVEHYPALCICPSLPANLQSLVAGQPYVRFAPESSRSHASPRPQRRRRRGPVHRAARHLSQSRQRLCRGGPDPADSDDGREIVAVAPLARRSPARCSRSAAPGRTTLANGRQVQVASAVPAMPSSLTAIERYLAARPSTAWGRCMPNAWWRTLAPTRSRCSMKAANACRGAGHRPCARPPDPVELGRDCAARTP